MENIEYIIGDATLLQRIPRMHPLPPFDARVIDFLNSVSCSLQKEKDYLLYPDLVTLAFWLREKNLERIAEIYTGRKNVLGRGLAFHIAPGNVALSFAYSLATGLLTGNTNIIRLPKRSFPQGEIFIRVLRENLQTTPDIKERILLIRYPHDKKTTDYLSGLCHTRIIWGGDDTVSAIRQSPLRPRATEITFANRFSLCVIDADKYLANYDPKKTAHDFYIDTYLTDQNACSSPRMVFWSGQNIAGAKKTFWDALEKEIASYEMAPVTTVQKLLTFCKFAAENPCRFAKGKDLRLVRVEVEEPTPTMLKAICHSGYFYECNIEKLSDIFPLMTWSLQTLSYIGLDGRDLARHIVEAAPFGVDRIVPTGRTMDFSLTWDGKNVVEEMTRIIDAR